MPPILKLKINNQPKFYIVESAGCYQDKCDLKGSEIKKIMQEYIDNLTEDDFNISLSEEETKEMPGFKIYAEDETTVLMNYTGCVYKWNIYTDYDDGIVLTSSKNDREREPDPNADPPQEVINPLNTEQLTECVAELMYQVDCNELGI